MVELSSVEAIIIGGDHHNTLSIIRALGRVNVSFSVLIHGNQEFNKLRIIKSKYVTENYFFVKNDEQEILKYLIEYKTSEQKKYVILTASDLGAYTVDNNLNLLKSKYICPSFDNNPGAICNLMDKFTQNKFAQDNNILVAKSWKVTRVNNEFKIPTDITFPCILKPLISVEGSKGDIKIVYNTTELYKELDIFIFKEYNQLIIQEFINKDYEICAFGCITMKSKKNIGGIIHKLREYPYKGGGSMTYAQFIFDSKIHMEVEKVVSLLVNNGYIGMYDIEFLVSGDKIYLNEINFRHSGNGHALINNNLNIHKLWILDSIGKEIDNQFLYLEKETYLMDELVDLHYIKDRKISLFYWIYQIIKTKSFTVFSKDDLPGTYAFYKQKIKSIFQR